MDDHANAFTNLGSPQTLRRPPTTSPTKLPIRTPHTAALLAIESMAVERRTKFTQSNDTA
jgi:hypothetical protein